LVILQISNAYGLYNLQNPQLDLEIPQTIPIWIGHCLPYGNKGRAGHTGLTPDRALWLRLIRQVVPSGGCADSPNFLLVLRPPERPDKNHADDPEGSQNADPRIDGQRHQKGLSSDKRGDGGAYAQHHSDC
jgi:hypothetical protein